MLQCRAGAAAGPKTAQTAPLYKAAMPCSAGHCPEQKMFPSQRQSPVQSQQVCNHTFPNWFGAPSVPTKTPLSQKEVGAPSSQKPAALGHPPSSPCRASAPAPNQRLFRKVKWFSSFFGSFHSQGLSLWENDRIKLDIQREKIKIIPIKRSGVPHGEIPLIMLFNLAGFKLS